MTAKVEDAGFYCWQGDRLVLAVMVRPRASRAGVAGVPVIRTARRTRSHTVPAIGSLSNRLTGKPRLSSPGRRANPDLRWALDTVPLVPATRAPLTPVPSEGSTGDNAGESA